MQEAEASTGKPLCGWQGLAEGKERKERGYGKGKEREEGLMLLNCVHEAELLTALGLRAEKENRPRIRSSSINFSVH